MIKACVSYSDSSKTSYYENFNLVDYVPEVEIDKIKNKNFHLDEQVVLRVEEVSIDCENSDELFNYDYYKVYYFNNFDYFNDLNSDSTVNDDDFYTSCDFVCVKNKECDFYG